MKNKKSLFLFAMLVLTFSLFLGACSNESGSTPSDATNDDTENADTEGASDVKQGGDLIVGSTSAPTLINDIYSHDVPSSDIENLIYNGLTALNENAEPVPDLAESWEHTDDGVEWTFYLRDDVTWHDGEPFTADDVVFTYNVPRHEDYNGPRGNYFENIEEIEAIDDHTVKITLKEFFAPFLVQTTPYGILPEHILGDVPVADLGQHEFNTQNPIGTGPYKFEEWRQGQHIRMVANEDYFDGRPNIDSVTYKIVPDSNAMLAQFQAGDIDFIAVGSDDLPSAQALVDRGEAQIETVVRNSFTYISYNQRLPLFQDKLVRQALTHALDRQQILESIMNNNGEIAHSPGSLLSWAYNEDVPKFDYDMELAKEKLTEAGWEDTDGDGILDKDGEDFTFTLKVQQGNTVREQIAQIAQQQWSELGMNVDINVVEWSAFLQQINGPDWDFDAHIIGLSASLDPSLTNYFHTDEVMTFNRAGYSNPELDEIMVESDRTIDTERRKELLMEAQAIIAEDQPYTFVYYSTNNYLFTPNLKGVQTHPTINHYNIEEWWIE